MLRSRRVAGAGLMGVLGRLVGCEDDAMDLRDYVFLGLAVLAAVAFFCNGFYLGVYRSWESFKSPATDVGQKNGLGFDKDQDHQGTHPKYTVITLFNFQVGPRRRGVDRTQSAHLRNN